MKSIEDKLKELTIEEKEILNGKRAIDKSLYTNKDNFEIEVDKIMSSEQMIDIRKHTRFVEFPAHKHDYIEFNYVYRGELTQIINGEKFNLKRGELLFFNKDIVHEIEECSEEDLVINFIIKPEFFDFIMSLTDDDNIIFDFLLKTMYSSSNKGEYLYFKVADEFYIQQILEKIIDEIYEPSLMSKATIKLLVGLLLVELIQKQDKIKIYSEDSFDKFIVLEVLKYIDKNYKEGTLFQISELLNQPHYKISKLIKKHMKMTFKELLQEKRLTKAKQLLNESNLVVTDIISLVGYENPTYFYRIFKEKYGFTPKVLKVKNKKIKQNRL